MKQILFQVFMSKTDYVSGFLFSDATYVSGFISEAYSVSSFYFTDTFSFMIIFQNCILLHVFISEPHAQHSPAHPSPVYHSVCQHSPTQPSLAQPSLSQHLPAQPSPTWAQPSTAKSWSGSLARPSPAWAQPKARWRVEKAQAQRPSEFKCVSNTTKAECRKEQGRD